MFLYVRSARNHIGAGIHDMAPISNYGRFRGFQSLNIDHRLRGLCI